MCSYHSLYHLTRWTIWQYCDAVYMAMLQPTSKDEIKRMIAKRNSSMRAWWLLGRIMVIVLSTGEPDAGRQHRISRCVHYN